MGRLLTITGKANEAEEVYQKARSLIPNANHSQTSRVTVTQSHLQVFLNLAVLIAANESRVEEADYVSYMKLIFEEWEMRSKARARAWAPTLRAQQLASDSLGHKQQTKLICKLYLVIRELDAIVLDAFSPACWFRALARFSGRLGIFSEFRQS